MQKQHGRCSGLAAEANQGNHHWTETENDGSCLNQSIKRMDASSNYTHVYCKLYVVALLRSHT